MSSRAWVADWFRRYDPWTVGALVVVLVAALTGAWRSAPAATSRTAPVATLAPVLLVVTARPAPTEQSIVVQSAALRLPRAVVAYAAPDPDGDVLGAIDSGRSYEIVARNGPEWLQLRIDGSGEVWIRRAELEGPDIATPVPTAAPIVVYVAPAAVATAAPEPTAAAEPAFRVGGCSASDAAAKCSRTLPRR
jgi:hypothetical protein